MKNGVGSVCGWGKERGVFAMTKRLALFVVLVLLASVFAVPAGIADGGGGSLVSVSPTSLSIAKGSSKIITITSDELKDADFEVTTDPNTQNIVHVASTGTLSEGIADLVVQGKNVGSVKLTIAFPRYIVDPVVVDVTVTSASTGPVGSRKIEFTNESVGDIEMKDNETRTVFVGTITNYADFVSAKVAVIATVSGMPAVAATIATDGKVSVTITKPAIGVYPGVKINLSASGCADVASAPFKVTVTKGEDPVANPVIKESMSIIGDSKNPNNKNFSNSATVVFTLEGVAEGTAVTWKSSRPAVISVNATTGVATLGKTKSQLAKATVITATYGPNNKTISKTYIMRNAPTTIKVQIKNNKGKWIDAPNPLVLKPDVKRVFRLTGPRLLSKQKAWIPKWSWTWASTDANVAKIGTAKGKIVTGPTVGTTATITFTTFDGHTTDVVVQISASKGLDLDVDGDILEGDDLPELTLVGLPGAAEPDEGGDAGEPGDALVDEGDPPTEAE